MADPSRSIEFDVGVWQHQPRPEPEQLSRVDLDTMTPEQISEAHREGRLNALKRGDDPDDIGDPDDTTLTGMHADAGHGDDEDFAHLDDLDDDALETLAAHGDRLARDGKIEGVTVPPAPDLKQGVRGDHSNTQLTRADLKNMTPADIMRAHRAGRLGHLTSGTS